MDVVFTIVSRNYAAQAATLMESLALAEPDARRVVIATDGPIPALAGKADVVEASSLDLPFAAMSLYYDALELNTAVKPTAFRRLLEEPGVGSVTYLDPDIWVYRPLHEVREGLSRANLCLTPHLTRPLAGEANPSDRTILQSGAYNLGFMAARRDPEIFALLDWWAEKCRFDCRVDFTGGLFTDQRWMDMAPGFVSEFARLRQPTLNLAYWNLEGRELTWVEGQWRVEGRPLGFFHFSGFDPKRPDLLSKHQDRTRVAPGTPLAALLSDYAQALLRNGHETANATPYAFDAFPSGRAVTAPMRRRALRAAWAGAPPPGLTEDAEAWLDAPDPESAAPGLPDVTRLMDQVWRENPAAERFDRATAEGRLAFHAWFEAESGVDGAARTAAKALLASHRAGVRIPAEAPWRESPHRGPSSSIGDWLRTAADDGSLRPCTAMIQARADLRRRFAGDPDGLLAWCAGVEAAAGRFSVDLLPGPALARLTEDRARIALLASPESSGLRREAFTAFTLARRARWPAALADPMQAAMAAPARGYDTPFIALFLAIWEARGDLQRKFPLDSRPRRFRFLRWLIGGGLAEYGVEFAALPARVRNHPMTVLARRSLRTPPAEPARAPPAGRCDTLAVIAGGAAQTGFPGNVVIYDPAANSFHADGVRRPAPPKRVGLVCLLSPSGLAAADVIALLSQGVGWDRAVGVWSGDAAAALTDADAVLGFIDEIWTPESAAPGVFRPHRRLDPNRPLDAALAAAVAP